MANAFIGAGGISIVRDGLVWRVMDDGTVTHASWGEDPSWLYTDDACTTKFAEVLVENESGIANAAVNYGGNYYAPGTLITQDLYMVNGIRQTCMPYPHEMRVLKTIGEQVSKPADLGGPIQVVAR